MLIGLDEKRLAAVLDEFRGGLVRWGSVDFADWGDGMRRGLRFAVGWLAGGHGGGCAVRGYGSLLNRAVRVFVDWMTALCSPTWMFCHWSLRPSGQSTVRLSTMRSGPD